MNCDDALPLKTLAQEQRLAITSVMKAVKVRDEDACTNRNLAKREDGFEVQITCICIHR